MSTTPAPSPHSLHSLHSPHSPGTTDRARRASTQALVLGGGGSTGNAWLIGVLAGLSAAGLDAHDGDLIVGTSAGATAAAQISGAPPEALFADVLASAPARARARTHPEPSAPAFVGRPSDHLQRLRAIIAAADDAADMRRTMGAVACAIADDLDGSEQARWRATVAARLPQHRWPKSAIRLTAVDAETGAPVVFDRDSGIELVDAVAASCAGGFAYRVGAHRYIDGGYRRNENADVATGFERVLVLSPLGGRSLHPPAWGMQLDAQVAELRALGSRVETVLPVEASEHLFGANAMDGSLRPAATRVGFEQGAVLAERLRGWWA